MFVSVLAVVIVTLLATTPRQARLTGQSQAAAIALLEFQSEWITNGNEIAMYQIRHPDRLAALGMNRFEVGETIAGASKQQDGPWGICWSRRYQIQRQRTNDNRWTLYRTRAFGLSHGTKLAWRNRLAVITNTP